MSINLKNLFNHAAKLLVAILILGGALLLAPNSAPAAYAQTKPLELRITGPSYVQAGQNITYVLTVKNISGQAQTDIWFWNDVPANTTYVSGGSLVAGTPNYVEFNIASLAANASQTVTWVAQANSGLAVGTMIGNENFNFFDTAIGDAPGGIVTQVEAPGTLAAVYKNAAGRPFDVVVDGFSFLNFVNEPPVDYSDDLGTDDLFKLFGPAVCQSGDTAATCQLSGPAIKWKDAQIKDLGLGRCDGLAATSLRLFDELPYKGNPAAPGDFQAGAVTTSDLDLPGPAIENYIAYYFQTQTLDPAYDAHYTASPVEIVNKLITDFQKTPPIAYTISIYKMPGYKDGHSITAYGVETVSPTESRILVYDNNFPQQREYITVDMDNNTWTYTTASTPGEPPDVYTGTATGATYGGLQIFPISARDLPAGQVFDCPFCNETSGSASVQAVSTHAAAAAAGMMEGEINFQYSGEGAILVINDEDQATGYAFDIEEDINEIPGAELVYSKGGLGLDVPPRITVPYVETDNTLYSVLVSGKTIDAVSEGSLAIFGAGYVMGVDSIELNPDEFLEIIVSPDGDYIAFRADETEAAPPIYDSVGERL